MNRFRLGFAAILAGCATIFGATIFGAAVLGAADDEPSKEGAAFFEKRVRPLLVKHCHECHSAESKELQGGLRLDWRGPVREGGDNGPAVVPGDVEKSLLIKAVRYQDCDLQMPPKAKLTDEEIADLEAWVKMGAPDPRAADPATKKNAATPKSRDHWSFQRPTNPAMPAVRNNDWPLTPVDRFVLSHLETKGLKPVEPADKRTLIRRGTYDLLGLPPTPVEIDAFLADESPDAFAKVVDRLLASPAYGERWGRHWLDVVRYSDTAGDNSDYPIPQMYRYRNWVFDAIGRDMPYNEFIRDQLAGDLAPAASDDDRRDKIIATGYLANAKRFGSYEDARYPWHLTIEDTIDNLGRTFLGLTINCCRCHDHKFDPLTSADYYALYGIFQSTRYPWPGIELDKAQRDLVPLAPPREIATQEQARQNKIAEFDERIRKLEMEKADGEERLKKANEPPGKNDKPDDVSAAVKRLDQLKQSIKAIRREREDFIKQPLAFELAYAIAEGKAEGKKKVGNACIQIKGDPQRPGSEVPRRFPTVLGGQTLSPQEKGSGRLQLAQWLADPANPLTARVMVNRIWHYHFGRGLVATPSDFGRQGRPPTHPELFDYLALRFVEGGWSIQRMHRLIMLSRTYQLSSRDDAANAAIDVDNESLWRYPRRRLDAESIRDSILQASGQLDRSRGGPHPFPPQAKWDYTQHNPFKAVYETNRRSVYLMTQRFQRHPYLALFDGADTNASTDRRKTSTTPLQALYLMNDPLVHEQARHLAQRLLAEAADDVGRVERAYLILFGRPVTSEEQSAARDYLARVGEALRSAKLSADDRTAKAWESLSRALLLSNEFVYVD